MARLPITPGSVRVRRMKATVSVGTEAGKAIAEALMPGSQAQITGGTLYVSLTLPADALGVAARMADFEDHLGTVGKVSTVSTSNTVVPAEEVAQIGGEA